MKIINDIKSIFKELTCSHIYTFSILGTEHDNGNGKHVAVLECVNCMNVKVFRVKLEN